ncbi:head-tail connector protein [Mycobacterium phage Sbash]|uniref:Head-to-tail connector protein n=1 Tax=Mycobacterium phage Sbash TaxID=1567475 RepID=A0A0A7RVP2_9CAUD|nr:head-tail connector protein [Mycobacterium phage Sbash]AJA43308.1 hypothetical protein PBI_SBASH_7 [Mycobacterium phage Sbash]
MAIVRAKEAFAYNDAQNVPRVVRPGDLFDDSDTAVKGRAHLFEPVEVNAERRRASIEDASAEPGRLRSVGKRSKKSGPEPVSPENGSGGTYA